MILFNLVSENPNELLFLLVVIPSFDYLIHCYFLQLWQRLGIDATDPVPDNIFLHFLSMESYTFLVRQLYLSIKKMKKVLFITEFNEE